MTPLLKDKETVYAGRHIWDASDRLWRHLPAVKASYATALHGATHSALCNILTPSVAYSCSHQACVCYMHDMRCTSNCSHTLVQMLAYLEHAPYLICVPSRAVHPSLLPPSPFLSPLPFPAGLLLATFFSMLSNRSSSTAS